MNLPPYSDRPSQRAEVQDILAPVILDIEASGFGRGSYPIEVGFVLENGKTFNALIRPEPEWTHWCDAAESLHGIPRDLLERLGKPVAVVADWLNEHLRGKQVYSDAWGNDLSWLGLLFDAAERPQLFHLEALSTRLNESQMKRWGQVKNMVTESLGVARHRASSDALILQHTWLRIQSGKPGARVSA